MRSGGVSKTMGGLAKSLACAHLRPLVALTCGTLVVVACKPVAPTPDAGLLVSDSSAPGSFEVFSAKENTTLKKYLLQSATLGTDDICPIPAGTKLTVESFRPEGIGHLRVFGLSEVQLPSGEKAQSSRRGADAESETEETAPTASSVPVPASPGAELTESAPTANEASDEKPQIPRPAELLKCRLLENASFLIFSSHFLRDTLPVREAVAVDDSKGGAAADSRSWIWPTRGRKVRNDSAGSGYFNAPRASGRGHQGLDIVAAVGEAVVATRSGTIIDPNWEGSYGRVLDVRHSQGYSSRYAHLSSFSYSHGTYVRQGDRIATAGRTGNASGFGITPHLHFEIRSGSRLQNPLSLLP